MVGGKACALCGLPVTGKGVVQSIDGQELAFCCGGCARVYQLARSTGTLEQVLAQSQAGRAPVDAAIARFAVRGMHCSNCVKLVVRTLREQPGVLDADLDLATGQGSLRYDPAQADLQKALHALDPLGYSAELLSQAN